MGTPSQMIIRWRTNWESDAKVFFGTKEKELNNFVADRTAALDHIIELKNLQPNTKYYYSIGTSKEQLGGDSSYFFTTAPPVGSTGKTRFWVTGDCGNNSLNQRNVLKEYEKYLGENYTNAWLLLGDNAYYNGLEDEYQYNFFDIYKDKMLKQTLLVPAPGNHDYAGNDNRQNDHNIPYYKIFSLPDSAQMGGEPSGTEAFYSYNYGNIHFISLDSYGREDYATRLYDTLGAQITWLKRDLAANKLPWTIAYWHHPPYTMGSHNSDTEAALLLIRQNVLRILERNKVELVLCGHSHSYERSYLINNYYGLEANFDKKIHTIDSSSAKYNGEVNSCPYLKNGENEIGTLYIVSGSAGQLGGSQATFPHNAMYFSDVTNGGSLILEIEDNRLDAKFLCADGAIRDNFSILKNVNKTHHLQVQSGDTLTLTASWIGSYKWSNHQNTPNIKVIPNSPISYFVSDSLQCLKDEFFLQLTGIACPKGMFLKMLPNPANKDAVIEFCMEEATDVSFSILDILGNKILTIPPFYSENGQHSFYLNEYTSHLTHGIYLLKMETGGKVWLQKIVI
jgi:predicted MPP superfamily phosphohydrolase